jgi:hypothetical protein
LPRRQSFARSTHAGHVGGRRNGGRYRDAHHVLKAFRTSVSQWAVRPYVSLLCLTSMSHFYVSLLCLTSMSHFYVSLVIGRHKIASSFTLNVLLAVRRTRDGCLRLGPEIFLYTGPLGPFIGLGGMDFPRFLWPRQCCFNQIRAARKLFVQNP